MLEIQLVETADSCEQNAILEFLHVTPRLAHDSRKGFFDIIFESKGLQRDKALWEVV